MIFTTKAEYGVRLLIQLGSRAATQPVSLKAVAEAENLPLAYLERIAALLKKAGLVERHPRRARRLPCSRGPPRRSRWTRSCSRSRARSRRWTASSTTRDGRVLCSHHADGEHCATKLLWTRVQMGVIKSLQRTTLAELVEFAPRARTHRRRAPLRRRTTTTTRRKDDMADLEIKNLHVSAGRQADPQGRSTCTSAPASSTR